MKKIEKLNTTTKMLLVLLYSFVLLVIASLLINVADAEDETKGYGTKARDHYIQLYTKVIETRTEPKLDEQNTKKEEANYGIYTQVIQLTDKEVKNIELYVTAETYDGSKIYYEESQKSSTIYKGKPNNNSTYFKTSPSGFNKKSTYKSNTDSYEQKNTMPKIVYMDVFYDVVLSNTEIVRKELKYYFVPTNPENEKFENYVASGTLTNEKQFAVDTKELKDYLKVNLRYTLPKQTADTNSLLNDNFEINLSANEDKFSAVGKYIVDSKISLFAKGKNHVTDTDNYFSDYILISENVGVLVNNGSSYMTDTVKNSLTSTYLRSSNIGSNYEVSELYLSISVTLNTGETVKIQEKFTLTR